MADICNILHAMLDAFISQITSKCDSLAPKVRFSLQLMDRTLVALKSTMIQKSTTCTFVEVLNSLKWLMMDAHCDASLKTEKSLLGENKLHSKYAMGENILPGMVRIQSPSSITGSEAHVNVTRFEATPNAIGISVAFVDLT